MFRRKYTPAVLPQGSICLKSGIIALAWFSFTVRLMIIFMVTIIPSPSISKKRDDSVDPRKDQVCNRCNSRAFNSFIRTGFVK